MASPSIKPNRKLSKRQLTRLMDTTERKYSVCITCDAVRIFSRDEADDHRERGHAVLDYMASKDMVVN